MSQIVSVHSFRGGTGKSNTTANIAALLAMNGRRVGVVDTDIQSPGIHVLFGLEDSEITTYLNDYLWGECTIEEAAYDLTDNLRGDVTGRIFLIPSSVKTNEIAKVLREGYDVGLLNDGFQDLIEALDLDVLLIDTHPGLNEETLLSIAISDVLLIVMRPDRQDFQGTAVTVEIANKLGVPLMLMVVNKIPQVLNLNSVRTQIEETYDVQVGALLNHSEKLMVLASEDVFVLRYPEHEITQSLQAMVTSAGL